MVSSLNLFIIIVVFSRAKLCRMYDREEDPSALGNECTRILERWRVSFSRRGRVSDV